MTKQEEKLKDAIIELFVSNNGHIAIVNVQGFKCLAIQISGKIELVPITDETFDVIEKVIEGRHYD